jgi:hypothetical protein
MKCVSCETEINPKWSHAIDMNVCPFCGQCIMEEHLKNCLVGLAAAMKDMQKYPEQLDDWLLSNHNYIKTDSPNLKQYLPKEIFKEMKREVEVQENGEPKISTIKIKLPGGGTQDVQVEKTQSEAKTNSFFERAEVLKGSGKTSGKAAKDPDEPEGPKSVVEKTQNLRAVAQQIRREVSNGAASENSLAAMMESADPEAVAEFQAVISSGDIINSGLSEASTGDDDEIHPAALAMARLAQPNSAGANHKDMQSLQEMQSKVQNAQKRLTSGKGSFSRGS